MGKCFKPGKSMKFTFFILLVIISLNTLAQVVIKGKILNYDGHSHIWYYPTIEGIHVPYWIEVQPTPNGKFKIEYENSGYGTVRFGFEQLQYRFFHDEDSKIYLEIDQQKINLPLLSKRNYVINSFVTIKDSVKQAATVLIRSDYQQINEFYNRNIRSSFISPRSGPNIYSNLFYKAPTSDKILSILDSLIQLEINQIGNIDISIDPEENDAGKINEEIKSFLSNEVKAFYGSMFLSGMRSKRRKQSRALSKDTATNVNLYNSEWMNFMEAFFQNTKGAIVPTPNSYDYIEFIESLSLALEGYKRYDNPGLDKSMDEHVIDRLLYTDSTFLLDKTSAFAYKLGGLQIYLNSQLFYSPALLNAVNELEQQYPGSANLEYFKPQIEKLRNYIKSSYEDFNKAEIIEKNYTSFRDVMGLFKGSNLLIDIWATWCHPCIEDFKYKSALESFLENRQLDILYISIDKVRWKDRWRNSIKYNELQGHHVRANDVLIADMWKVLGGFVGAIPRYVLVDKKGNIFISTAARPSENNILVQQISDLIAQSEG